MDVTFTHTFTLQYSRKSGTFRPVVNGYLMWLTRDEWARRLSRSHEDSLDRVILKSIVEAIDQYMVPKGLVISDDGSTLNWRGQNYYALPEDEATTSPPISLPRVGEVWEGHELNLLLQRGTINKLVAVAIVEGKPNYARIRTHLQMLAQYRQYKVLEIEAA